MRVRNEARPFDLAYSGAVLQSRSNNRFRSTSRVKTKKYEESQNPFLDCHKFSLSSSLCSSLKSLISPKLTKCPSARHTLTPIATHRLDDYKRMHTTSEKTSFKIVPGDRLMRFPVGSELVGLETEVLVAHTQKGYFPPLKELIPKEDLLHVVVTRDFATAEQWVEEREKEGIDFLGYMVHIKDKVAWEPVAAYFNKDTFSEEEVKKIAKGEFFNLDRYDIEDDQEDKNDDFQYSEIDSGEEEEEGELVEEEGDVEGEDYDFLEDLYGDDSDNEEEEEIDENDDFSKEIYNLKNYNPPQRGITNSLLEKDYYFLDTVKQENDWKEYQDSLPKPPVKYKMGNMILEWTPSSREVMPKPPAPPPKVYTMDPVLAGLWESDVDGPDPGATYPPYVIPLGENVISVLSLCVGRHVLILQLRRMSVIGPRLFDMLYDRKIKKVSFGHVTNSLALGVIGVSISSGNEIGQMLNWAFETTELTQVPYEFRNMPPHGFARVLAGVDISDRELYLRDWNNPLLCEREVACLAKEAFALYAIRKVLTSANRTYFFDINVFVQNMLPPSFVEKANSLPLTTHHEFIITRGVIYEDLGKLIPKMQFNLKVTVTRDIEVADWWCERVLSSGDMRLGYHQEWVQGHKNKITAIFTIATENEVLICQQLYFPSIPSNLQRLLYMRMIRKSGPSVILRLVKRKQPMIKLQGCDFVFQMLIPMMGKRKKKNFPKVVRDLDFNQLSKLIVGVENPVSTEYEKSESVRWDKPSFTKDEIEYQALRAWEGWAIGTIFDNVKPDSGERFKAYLEGSRYRPKKKKLPLIIRKKFEKFTRKEEEEVSRNNQENTNEVNKQPSPVPLRVSFEDVKDLIDNLL